MINKHRPRVMVVTGALAQGGGETVSVNLANALKRHGCQVAFASERGPLESRLLSGIPFFALPLFSLLNIVAVLRALCGAVSGFKPDVVHSQTATHCFLLRSLFLFRKRPPLILTHHASTTEKIPNFMSGFVFNFIADKIVSIANHRKRDLLRLGVKSNKLFSVPNFIDIGGWRARGAKVDRAALRKDVGFSRFEYIFLISARLIPSKEVDVFIRAIAGIVKSGRNVAGIILGDGPEFSNLKKIAVSLGLQDRILFKGFTVDVLPYYFAADIFLFPSRHHEVLPMVLIEAGASGLPMICSDIPGNDEVVREGMTGFLLDGPVEDYVAKAIMLLDDSKLYAKFSENAADVALKVFDEKVCVSQFVEIYSDAIDKLKTHRR